MTLEFPTKLVNGRLPLEEAKKIAAVLKDAWDKHVTIKITFGKKRSLSQNDYWFKMLGDYAVPVFRSYGENWTKWKIHVHVMEVLGYIEELPGKNGEPIVTRLNSGDFNTTQWEEFMDRARAHLAVEHSVFIPLPNEKDYSITNQQQE